MRISTSMFYRQGTRTMSELQSQLLRTQNQLASGNRLQSPSDDPVAAARILDITASIEQNTQYQRNFTMARNRLGMEEQSLIDVENAVFRIRELALQANNDTLDSETRSYIAAEATEVLGQLVQIANSQDVEGNYLFAGFSSQTQPFTQTGGVVNYNGDQGQREIQISETRFVADGDSGSDVFMAIETGNGQFAASASNTNLGTGVIGARTTNDSSLWDNQEYTVQFSAADAYQVLDSGGAVVSSNTFVEGDEILVQGASIVLTGAPEAGDEFTIGPARQQDMFTTFQNFIDALDAPVSPQGTAQLHNEVGSVLENLDRGIDNVLEIRTQIGTRLQAIDSQEVSNADFTWTLEAARADLQQLDYAEAVTSLSQQLAGLEAAQQSFARIQGLSLFNYIR